MNMLVVGFERKSIFKLYS